MRNTFTAKIEQLRSILTWVRNSLVGMDFDSATLRKIELAAEEALVNVIHHAYQKRPEKIEIEIKAFPKSHVEIAIRDTGPPFDPLQRQEPNTNACLEDREIGGLGIYLMRQYMDEIHYQRDHNQNVLTLIKKVTRSFQAE